MITNSQQEEKQFRVGSLQCMNKFSESLNNVATAMLSLSQSIQQNMNKNLKFACFGFVYFKCEFLQ